MANKSYKFQVSLRLGRRTAPPATHTVTLEAPTKTEANRKARHDAVATSGGDFSEWSVTSCDKLGAATAAQAA